MQIGDAQPSGGQAGSTVKTENDETNNMDEATLQMHLTKQEPDAEVSKEDIIKGSRFDRNQSIISLSIRNDVATIHQRAAARAQIQIRRQVHAVDQLCQRKRR